MQTKLAVTAVRGFVFHLGYLKCQTSLQHFDTCLSVMRTVKDLCPDKQAIAEAFACGGKQIAQPEFSNFELCLTRSQLHAAVYEKAVPVDS